MLQIIPCVIQMLAPRCCEHGAKKGFKAKTLYINTMQIA
jgi:hypothetical protein